MALKHSNITVGTSPTWVLKIPKGNPYTCVTLYNSDNSSIYIGDSSLTTNDGTRGITLKKDTPTTLWLNAGDELYAISAAGTSADALAAVYSIATE